MKGHAMSNLNELHDLMGRVVEWKAERKKLCELEDRLEADPDDWEASDDEASILLHDLADWAESWGVS